MDLCLRVKNNLLRVTSIVDDVPGIMTLPQLEEFLSILENEPMAFLDDRIRSLVSTVSNDMSCWPLLLSPVHRKRITDDAGRAIKLAMSDSENRRYLATWIKLRQFLDTLSRVYVIPKPWSQLREKCPAMQGKQFTPSILSGGLPRTVYTTAGTSTGRLTVTAGPNFLVTPAASRQALRPASTDNALVIIDFTSMEPRVATLATGIDVGTEDIYEQLMSICDIENRATAKLATISALYGASAMRLVETVGSKTRAKSLIESVRNFFEVATLENRLEEQSASGLMRNLFGRPLHEATRTPRLRVNHFAQSSAAELAVLLFADLCHAVPSLVPTIVIHDALVAEVPRVDMAALLIASQELSFQGTKFPTTVATV